jgi:WD40 repeat protein
MNLSQNKPLPYDAVLGGKSPPPFGAGVLGGMAGVQWRLNSSCDRTKINALGDALNYGDRGKDFLTNLINTETGLLLWTAYHLLWQADKKNLIFSGRVTQTALAKQGMQKRFGDGKLIEAIALTDKLTLLLTSAGASLFQREQGTGNREQYYESMGIEVPPPYDSRTGEESDSNVDRDNQLSSLVSDRQPELLPVACCLLPRPQVVRQILWQIDCPTECATISPDRTAIALGWKHHIYLWNLRNGQLIQHLETDCGWVYSLVFSPDSKLITAKISNDRSIALWDVSSGELVRKLKGHTAFVKNLTFSPDGKLLASGGENNVIRLWNIETGKQLQRLEEEDGWRCLGASLVFSPDSKLLAVASDRYFGREDGIRLWDVKSGRAARLLQSDRQGIVNLAFSHDSKLLIAQSKERALESWNVASGEVIATTNTDNSIPCANYFQRDRWQQLEKSIDSLSHFAIDPEGQILATSRDDNTICLRDLVTGKQLQLLTGHQEAISSLAFSPIPRSPLNPPLKSGEGGEGKILASASKDRAIALWDVATGKQLKLLIGHQQEISSLAFSPDGKLLASASWDKTVRLWDVASGCQQQILFGHKGCVRTVAFSPDGKLLASGSWDKTVRLWNVASGTQVRAIRTYRDVLSVAFSPDGTAIASGGWDYFGSGSTLRLWDVDRGKQIKWLESYSRTVHSVAFSADGQFLATGGGDWTIRLWDLATGKQVKRLEGHARSVTQVAFTQNDRQLISGSGDRTVRVWQIDNCADRLW